MKTKGKLLLVLLAALVLLYFVFVQQIFNTVSFDEELEKINAIDEKFELQGKLVPTQEQELKEYNIELIDLEKELSEKKKTMI